MLEHFCFSRYNPPPQIQLTCTDESRTQQHFKGECDINSILSKYMQTGILTELQGGTYLDVSESPEYREAIHTIMDADNAFQLLPSNIRKEFDNNPAKYMDFLHNPKNAEAAAKLGLAIPQKILPSSQNSKIEPQDELS